MSTPFFKTVADDLAFHAPIVRGLTNENVDAAVALTIAVFERRKMTSDEWKDALSKLKPSRVPGGDIHE